MTDRITNTTDEVRAAPILGAFALMDGGQGVVASEARGQRELLTSEVLPTNMRGDTTALEALGFKFGVILASDTLFRQATLPEGWKREGSSHNQWSYIVDERGIRRVSVYYKAAFYDREAFMSLTNVGHGLATDALYADALPTAASLKLKLLTPAERAELEAGFDRMEKQVAEEPDIYGKYKTRLQFCRALTKGR